MNSRILVKCLFCCVFCILYFHQDVQGQFAESGSDSLVNTILSEKSFYRNRTKPFEKGTHFESESTQTIDHHQYFKTPGWTRGTLVFNGRVFDQVDMAYNIYEDLLLVLNLKMGVSGVKALKIDQSEVNAFVLYDHQFVSHSQLENPPANYGFYERYFHGSNLSVYIKHARSKSIEADGVKYPEKKNIYILRDGQYFSFQSKKNLFELFPEHRKNIRQFINKNAPRLNRRNLEGLRSVLVYCDGLGNEG